MVDSNSNRDRDGAALDQPPAVSVIVPIYNGEADLPGLLAGLQGQDYPRDRVDYWLVDNGSRDRTPALLAAAAAQNIQFHALTYRDIQSSYAARNAGIQAATGQILAFTDADCQPEPSWLRELVRPFADPTVGLVAGGIHALSSQHWLERYAERQGTLSQTNTLNHSFLPYGQTANLAVRAEVFRQVGLFRPYLTTGGDADFCWRVQQQTSWQLASAERAVVCHRHRRTLDELRRQWHRYGCSNRYLHDLHGVDLMRSLTPGEVRYRLLRWGLKELPQATVKLLTRRGTALDLALTPSICGVPRPAARGNAPPNFRPRPAILPTCRRIADAYFDDFRHLSLSAYPGGTQIRTFYLLKHLSQRHAVTLVTQRSPSVSDDDVAALSGYVDKLVCFPQPTPADLQPGRLGKVSRFAQFIATGTPPAPPTWPAPPCSIGSTIG